MSLISIPTTVLDLPRLKALKDNRVSENAYIEYKEAIGTKPEEKKKFLAAVSSFANTFGGDLLIGVRAPDGVPTAFPGILLSGLDAEKQRIENLILNGLEPRLELSAVKEIPVNTRSCVLVLRIARSWKAPHRVTLEGHDKFYGRHSAGRFPMNVVQLRNAFLMSESFAESAREHREKRINAVKSGRTPVILKPGAKTILHLLPLDAFRAGPEYDLAPADLSLYPRNQREHWPSPWGTVSHYNFDGIVISNRGFYGDKETAGNCYVQFSRNGIVEAVENYLLNGMEGCIPIEHFQSRLLEIIPQFAKIMERMGVQPPVAIMVSLVGVKGFCLDLLRDLSKAIDRDDLLIPEVLLDNFTLNALPSAMRPVFDTLWQSCNSRACPSYDADGNWSPDTLRNRLNAVLM